MRIKEKLFLHFLGDIKNSWYDILFKEKKRIKNIKIIKKKKKREKLN